MNDREKIIKNNIKFILFSSANTVVILSVYDIVTNKNVNFKNTFIYALKLFLIATFTGTNVILLKEIYEDIR